MVRRGWVALVLGTAALAGPGCIDHSGGAQCTPDKHCVTNGDGTVECETGYRWEDESDETNFNCVPDVPDAGS